MYDMAELRLAKEENMLLLDSYLFFYQALGLTRFQPIDKILDSFKTGNLTEEDKAIYKAIAYKRYPNKTMMTGMLSLPEDIELIKSMPKTDVPMLLFISNGKELGMSSPEKWIQLQKGYVANNKSATYIELDCGHSMHNIEYNRISIEIKSFIEGLD